MGTPASGQSHQVGAANAPLLHANPPAAAQRTKDERSTHAELTIDVAILKYLIVIFLKILFYFIFVSNFCYHKKACN